jgi:DnaJ-domain-containing protein 1
MSYSDAQILEVMIRLGLNQADIMRAQHSQRALDALKSHLKKAYKRLALECHPDRTEGDTEKAALFQLATHVVKEIEAIEAHPNPRRIKWAARIRARVA